MPNGTVRVRRGAPPSGFRLFEGVMQRAETGEAVGGDEPAPRQLAEPLLYLGGEQAGGRHQLVEERGAACLENLEHPRGVG